MGSWFFFFPLKEKGEEKKEEKKKKKKEEKQREKERKREKKKTRKKNNTSVIIKIYKLDPWGRYDRYGRV